VTERNLAFAVYSVLAVAIVFAVVSEWQWIVVRLSAAATGCA
jgi:hypothetical protein